MLSYSISTTFGRQRISIADERDPAIVNTFMGSKSNRSAILSGRVIATITQGPAFEISRQAAPLESSEKTGCSRR